MIWHSSQLDEFTSFSVYKRFPTSTSRLWQTSRDRSNIENIFSQIARLFKFSSGRTEINFAFKLRIYQNKNKAFSALFCFLGSSVFLPPLTLPLSYRQRRIWIFRIAETGKTHLGQIFAFVRTLSKMTFFSKVLVCWSEILICCRNPKSLVGNRHLLVGNCNLLVRNRNLLVENRNLLVGNHMGRK
jgi:hypothetical protein